MKGGMAGVLRVALVDEKLALGVAGVDLAWVEPKLGPPLPHHVTTNYF